MKNYEFLFDLGGVFFNWDPRHYFENVFNNKKDMEYFLTQICNDSWNLKQDAGRLIKEAENELINQFPSYKNFIESYYKNHKNMIKNVFENSIDLLKKLKKNHYNCYVLSNWSSETFLGFNKLYPFLNDFDGIIISGEEKLVKPDTKIFHLACNRFNLVPTNTIFIDDRIENIKSAKKLKFNTIHLTDPKEIIKKVSKFVNLN